jgi:hypothetical protein
MIQSRQTCAMPCDEIGPPVNHATGQSAVPELNSICRCGRSCSVRQYNVSIPRKGKRQKPSFQQACTVAFSGMKTESKTAKPVVVSPAEKRQKKREVFNMLSFCPSLRDALTKEMDKRRWFAMMPTMPDVDVGEPGLKLGFEGRCSCVLRS